MLVFVAAMELQAETTIYVGKHFEVRDHDQPTKYVFNGNTRVARITGSLSANTRIQRFRLLPGWNLLSLAVTAPNALEQLTDSQFSILNSQSVVRWNQPTQNWLRISKDETLSAGTVLWVNANSNAMLAITGAYTEPTNRPMLAGGDYLPSAGLEVLPLLGERAGVRADVTLSHFDPFTQHWEQRLPSIPFLDSAFPEFLPPGAAIFARADSPSELIVPAATLRIRYYHQDHLGSSSVMTDANGALIEETAFYPFGIPRYEHRLRQIEEFYKFTQKERDQESGLHYFEARLLAGTLSRFLSPDPKYANLQSSPSDPQELSLYAYVANNPLQYTDPTGLDRDSEIGRAAASGIARGLAGDDTASAAGIAGATASGIASADGGFDAASLSAGFGDRALDSIDPTFGFFWSGHRLGPTIREGLGINNVNEASGEYVGGGMAFDVAEALVGTGVIKVGFSRGAQTVAGTVGTETSTATKTLVGVPPPPVNPRPSYAAQKVLDRATKTGQLEMVQGTGMTRQQYNTAANAYSNRLMAERRAEMNAVLDAGGSVKSYIAWIGREVRRAFPIGPP